MRNYFVVIVACFSLVSCVDGIKRISEPDNLIPRDKMVEVLSEMVKLEAHIKEKYVTVNEFNKVMVNSGDSLLKSYNITFEDFDNSMSYYGARHEQMQGIYSDALERLNQELGELQSTEDLINE